ncbi:hypothetical protein GCM10009804_61550 [Kribbella hippodromi]|uniref:AAA family ATPase n=1 Tax=Kribbella hippodromi TaxID=434347 RepID=A0ABP4Q262_9ACTN
MGAVRVLLIGGTSNAGKSTVAQVIARRLGYEYVSTDRLGRHPGRPWTTTEQDVPEHVVEHYRSLTEVQLVEALLKHYERMWPRVEELISTHTPAPGVGLLLEGSGVWPEYVVRLGAPYTAAVWLTADKRVLADRIHDTSRYDELTADRRLLVDKFLARSLDYQSAMLDQLNRLHLAHLDTTNLTLSATVENVRALTDG